MGDPGRRRDGPIAGQPGFGRAPRDRTRADRGRMPRAPGPGSRRLGTRDRRDHRGRQLMIIDTHRRSAAARLALLAAGAGAALVLLDRAAGALPPMAWSDPWSLVSRTDPIVVAFASLRLVAMALCWYLL